MLKRALNSHHWMAIGLDKWNDLENADITDKMIAKMRRIERSGADSDSNDSDLDDSELDDSQDDGSIDECKSKSDTENERELRDDASEVAEKPDPFMHCEICPGRKFLTEKDMQEHNKSAKHLKKAQMLASKSIPVVTPAKQMSLEKSARSSKSKVVEEKGKNTTKPPVSNTNNRKARRAHLAREKN